MKAPAKPARQLPSRKAETVKLEEGKKVKPRPAPLQLSEDQISGEVVTSPLTEPLPEKDDIAKSAHDKASNDTRDIVENDTDVKESDNAQGIKEEGAKSTDVEGKEVMVTNVKEEEGGERVIMESMIPRPSMPSQPPPPGPGPF